MLGNENKTEVPLGKTYKLILKNEISPAPWGGVS